MPQYAIMRFAKQKGGAGALEAHHERTKEKYASNPDINTERSKYIFFITTIEGRTAAPLNEYTFPPDEGEFSGT